jgi:hypothetical protein
VARSVGLAGRRRFQTGWRAGASLQSAAASAESAASRTVATGGVLLEREDPEESDPEVAVGVPRLQRWGGT